MATNITDLIMLQYFIRQDEKAISVIQKRINANTSELTRRCFHPKNYRVNSVFAYDQDAEKCTICGQII